MQGEDIHSASWSSKVSYSLTDSVLFSAIPLLSKYRVSGGYEENELF